MSRGPWKNRRPSPHPVGSREYNAQRQREWRLANKARESEKVRARMRVKRDFIQSFKRCPCADCGVQYPPFVMDFDHRNPAEKSFTISVGLTHTLDRLAEEIAKCDVVCANCHRVRTFTRGEEE